MLYGHASTELYCRHLLYLTASIRSHFPPCCCNYHLLIPCLLPPWLVVSSAFERVGCRRLSTCGQLSSGSSPGERAGGELHCSCNCPVRWCSWVTQGWRWANRPAGSVRENRNGTHSGYMSQYTPIVCRSTLVFLARSYEKLGAQSKTP